MKKTFNDRTDKAPPSGTETVPPRRPSGVGVAPLRGKAWGVLESLEGLGVAFILAFVARGFVVEAFFIPTGSMAPTLRGAHVEVVCPDCGHRYAVGIETSPSRPENLAQPMQRQYRPTTAICPNCHWRLFADVLRRLPDRSGDRILVLKWLEFFQPPRRFDIMVFKNPQHPETNFIKRLIGLPNEVIELIDGQVFHAPTDSLTPSVRERLSLSEPMVDWTTEDRLRYHAALRIAKKPEKAQEALWMLLYDSDELPVHERSRAAYGRVWPRWEPMGGKGGEAFVPISPKPSNPNGSDAFRFYPERLNGSHEASFLRYSGPIADFYAYNVRSAVAPQVVSDLRIRCIITPQSPEGAVLARLSKHGRIYEYRLDFSGKTRLTERLDSQTRILAEGLTPPWIPGRSKVVSFENVDFQLRIRVDNQTVLAYDIPVDIERLRNREQERDVLAAIGGRSGRFTIRRLGLERDVHYVNLNFPGYAGKGHGTEGNPILLGTDAFFVLGDNSPASQDSRLWTKGGPATGPGYRIGTVPRSHILGKAFFVYWPSGEPILGDRFPLVPRVGRMKMIH